MENPRATWKLTGSRDTNGLGGRKSNSGTRSKKRRDMREERREGERGGRELGPSQVRIAKERSRTRRRRARPRQRLTKTQWRVKSFVEKAGLRRRTGEGRSIMLITLRVINVINAYMLIRFIIKQQIQCCRECCV